jgi:hypothetical protein
MKSVRRWSLASVVAGTRLLITRACLPPPSLLDETLDCCRRRPRTRLRSCPISIAGGDGPPVEQSVGRTVSIAGYAWVLKTGRIVLSGPSADVGRITTLLFPLPGVGGGAGPLCAPAMDIADDWGSATASPAGPSPLDLPRFPGRRSSQPGACASLCSPRAR